MCVCIHCRVVMLGTLGEMEEMVSSSVVTLKLEWSINFPRRKAFNDRTFIECATKAYQSFCIDILNSKVLIYYAATKTIVTEIS